MRDILQNTAKCVLFNQCICNRIKIALMYVPNRCIDNELSLCKAKAWYSFCVVA